MGLLVESLGAGKVGEGGGGATGREPGGVAK